jgi:hypothetical protein
VYAAACLVQWQLRAHGRWGQLRPASLYYSFAEDYGRLGGCAARICNGWYIMFIFSLFFLLNIVVALLLSFGLAIPFLCDFIWFDNILVIHGCDWFLSSYVLFLLINLAILEGSRHSRRDRYQGQRKQTNGLISCWIDFVGYVWIWIIFFKKKTLSKKNIENIIHIYL